MLEELKQIVCEQNHELPAAGLVVGSGGNVSARDPETGLVVIKPSGVKFAKLTPYYFSKRYIGELCGTDRHAPRGTGKRHYRGTGLEARA